MIKGRMAAIKGEISGKHRKESFVMLIAVLIGFSKRFLFACVVWCSAGFQPAKCFVERHPSSTERG